MIDLKERFSDGFKHVTLEDNRSMISVVRNVPTATYSPNTPISHFETIDVRVKRMAYRENESYSHLIGINMIESLLDDCQVINGSTIRCHARHVHHCISDLSTPNRSVDDILLLSQDLTYHVYDFQSTDTIENIKGNIYSSPYDLNISTSYIFIIPRDGLHIFESKHNTRSNQYDTFNEFNFTTVLTERCKLIPLNLMVID